mgnify:FL=1
MYLKNIVFNIILVLFPILIYFVYNCYNEVNNNKNKKTALELSLFTSLYLCLKFGNFEADYNDLLIICNIPILFAYLKRKEKISIILSLFLILYSYFNFDINIYLVISVLLTYFITYVVLRKKIDNKSFIIVTATIQAFIISFITFININSKVCLTIDIFLLILVYILLSAFILYLFDIMDKLSGIYLNIKELERDKQLKNSLFKLTHEIKNPLAVCKGYLTMINIDNKEKTEKYLNIIKQEIERSLNIMADFSELNKIKLNKELIDINMLVEEVYNSLNLLMYNKNITINYKNNEEIFLSCDYNKIKQVLINLIKNSYEAITNEGIIDIKTYKDKNSFYIEIKDNGSGMDENTLDKITEMFYTTKQEGTGLGVVLSNEIIKAHNGTLKYESKLNQGTKAIIKLPLK